jgi:cytochrome P450
MMLSFVSKVSFDRFSIGDFVLLFVGSKFKRHASLTIPLFRRNKITPNYDLIMDCTDKLLVKWRSDPPNHVHLDIVQQCRNLLLVIFGFLAFDYDLGTLNNNDNNELTQALKDFLDTIYPVFFLPKLVSIIYLKLNPRYRRARTIIQQYVYRMIDHELAEYSETIAERKRTSLIASLVSALQKDEKTEMVKSEEEKTGQIHLF